MRRCIGVGWWICVAVVVVVDSSIARDVDDGVPSGARVRCKTKVAALTPVWSRAVRAVCLRGVFLHAAAVGGNINRRYCIQISSIRHTTLIAQCMFCLVSPRNSHTTLYSRPHHCLLASCQSATRQASSPPVLSHTHSISSHPTIAMYHQLLVTIPSGTTADQRATNSMTTLSTVTCTKSLRASSGVVQLSATPNPSPTTALFATIPTSLHPLNQPVRPQVPP